MASGCVLVRAGSGGACTEHHCSGHGECVIGLSGLPRCECYPGFLPVGTTCFATCSSIDCGIHGRCVSTAGASICLCESGFVYDGQTCVAQRPPGSSPADGGVIVEPPLDDGGGPSPGSLHWVALGGGTFLMGTDDGDQDEKPVHDVTVGDFDMLEKEVTVSQYGECVAAGGCVAPRSYDDRCNWDESDYADHPVNCVSWQEAFDYCRWAGGRLPSEAEWEYAARSRGQAFRYPWGDDEPTCDKAVFNEHAPALPHVGCGTRRSWPPCSKRPGNTWQGLCDMAGNLAEWVQDVYLGSYEGAPRDGSAREGRGSDRVFRGGGLNNDGWALRATARDSDVAGRRSYALSFRCARVAP